jgi:chromosome partitioning protein
MLRTANRILIPVGPSAIDIHATANFIKDLLLRGRIQQRGIQLAVLANRVRDSRPTYEPLERFVQALGIPFLTRLRDSAVFVEAAETGIGIFEMDESASAREREDFMPVVDWVCGGAQASAAPTNVVALRKAIGLS